MMQMGIPDEKVIFSHRKSQICLIIGEIVDQQYGTRPQNKNESIKILAPLGAFKYHLAKLTIFQLDVFLLCRCDLIHLQN